MRKEQRAQDKSGVVVPTKLPVPEAARFRALARERGTTASAEIRRLVRAELDANPTDREEPAR